MSAHRPAPRSMGFFRAMVHVADGKRVQVFVPGGGWLDLAVDPLHPSVLAFSVLDVVTLSRRRWRVKPRGQR